MRVAIINFEMSEASGVLAWQASIAREIAAQVEHVLVLTDELDESLLLPSNMVVEVLPRRPLGIPRRAGSGWLLNARIFRLMRGHKIDACFIHMAHEWSYRFAPALKALRIPVLMWYAHGHVPFKLRLSTSCATKIVTSTREGFRLSTEKLKIIGQAIDTDLFRPFDGNYGDDIIYVGRVSPRKRIDLLVDAMERVREHAPDLRIRLRIVGPVLTHADIAYDHRIRSRIWGTGLQDWVSLEGFVPQRHTPDFYRTAFLHLNLSETGSMDKTVMEALACGCPVITSNPAFRDILCGHPEFLLDSTDADTVAQRILFLRERRPEYSRSSLRELVIGRHDMTSYVKKIVTELSELQTAALRTHRR